MMIVDVDDERTLYQVAVSRVLGTILQYSNMLLVYAFYLCPLSSTRKMLFLFLNLLVRRH
jgi:hypothetical protein